MTAPTAIDDYLARFDGERRATLDRLHATLRTLLPTAQETLKYRMPAFVVHGGKAVAGLDEISAVADGARIDYFPDGRVKAEGRMKAGRLHGAWKWYRHDGSLMRAGHFLHGEQSGVWATFDRSGRLVTAKRL